MRRSLLTVQQVRGWCPVQRFKSTASTEIPVTESNDAKPFDTIPGPTGLATMKYFGMKFLLKPFTNFTPETIHKLWTHLHDKYGDIYRLRLGGIWAVFTANVDDVSAVLYHGGKYPYRRAFPILTFAYENTGTQPSLAALNGPEWYRLRQAIKGRMVPPKAATHYLPSQNEVTNEFVQRIKTMNFTPDQLTQEYFKFACESIGVVCYNARLGCFSTEPAKEREMAEFITNLNTMFRLQFLTNTAFPFYTYFRTRVYDTYEKAFLASFQVGRTCFDKAIAEIKTKTESGSLNTDVPNFLLGLMSEDKLSEEEIFGISSDLFLGGVESTGVNLQMLLYLLAKNPDQQERLYKEILQHVGPHNDLTPESLDKMSFLKASVRESLRMIFPITSGMLRILESEVILSGYRIPARTLVICNSRRMSSKSEYFPEPERYLPERWLRDESGKRKTPKDTIASIPFGLGHRTCIGRRFAEQELYLAVTKLLQTFKIKLGPTFQEPEIIYHTFARARNPIDIQFVSRE